LTVKHQTDGLQRTSDEDHHPWTKNQSHIHVREQYCSAPEATEVQFSLAASVCRAF